MPQTNLTGNLGKQTQYFSLIQFVWVLHRTPSHSTQLVNISYFGGRLLQWISGLRFNCVTGPQNLQFSYLLLVYITRGGKKTTQIHTSFTGPLLTVRTRQAAFVFVSHHKAQPKSLKLSVNSSLHPGVFLTFIRMFFLMQNDSISF